MAQNVNSSTASGRLTGSMRVAAMSNSKTSPGPLAHHSSVVYQNDMYLFGGSNGTKENKHFYKLDLTTFTWQILDSFKRNSYI